MTSDQTWREGLWVGLELPGGGQVLLVIDGVDSEAAVAAAPIREAAGDKKSVLFYRET